MTNDAHAWDRLAAGIRGVLPEWARYQGYGTYALAGYLWAAILAGVAGVSYSQGWYMAAGTAAGMVVFSWSLGSYYKGAAKLRVTCDHCDAHAHGQSICPECGELTYTGGKQ